MNYVLAYLWFNIRSGKANRIESPRKPTVLQTLQSELHVPKALKSKADSIIRRRKNTTFLTIYARYGKIASINRLHTPLSSGEPFRRSDAWKRTRVGRAEAFSRPYCRLTLFWRSSACSTLTANPPLASRRRLWRAGRLGQGGGRQHNIKSKSLTNEK